MKKIWVHYPDMPGNSLFDPTVRDNCNAPYIHLKQRLAALGYELAMLHDQPIKPSEWILFFDATSVYGAPFGQRLVRRLTGHGLPSRRDVYQECLDAGLGHRIALFLLESPAIVPRNNDADLHARFPIVFTWHDGLVDNQHFFKLNIPQPSHFPSVEPRPFDSKKLLANTSSNKYRRHKHELYTERRRSIRYFEKAHPTSFDLYGVGWNKPSGIAQRLLPWTIPTYSSYRGTVANKWDVYPEYRFGLCYENVSDEPGYITEKIFDCMRSDCVPIYHGAQNVADYIPSEAFVDRRQFASNDELARFIEGMPETEYEGYRSAIHDFLIFGGFRLFLEEAFAAHVLTVLGLSNENEQLMSQAPSQFIDTSEIR